MKKIVAALMLLGAGVPLGAQTLWDAYNFSQTNYYGTARSVALGNAMTAVGGDLGSITFNPAGAAVTTYSQFVLTPSISVSSTGTVGQAMTGDSSPYCFQDMNKTNMTRFKMPNFGLMLNMDTGRSRGIRNWTFGFVGNATHNYQNSILATGTNRETSLAGALAAKTSGIPQDNLTAGWWDRVDPLPDWNSMLAYQSGIIDTYNGLTDQYIGVTERLLADGGIQLTDIINQEYGSRRTGNKYDLLTNMAFNVSDRFFFGANIGITSLSYRNEEYWLEQAVNPNNFALNFADGSTLHFDYLRMRYSYEADGSGIYAKAGFLWRVFGGLRIAAAIQSPTAFSITERYGYDAKTVFRESENYAEVSTPQDEWTYSMRSPWLYNLGVAYTIGSSILLSADYERVMYNSMRFRSDSYDFSYLNSDIRANMGVSNNLRVGAEVRVLPELAVRGGYTYTSNPLKDYVNGERSSYSLGLGYSSPGSFFADLAVRVNTLPEEHLNIYADYAYDAAGNLQMPSPTVNINTTLTDVLVTVGWRF
ncbi:MAG: outer membrane protein transport protein [Bacteroidales bacterium]|nr:outer membrane protein transport protein [Bacteroidales bacterium]